MMRSVFTFLSLALLGIFTSFHAMAAEVGMAKPWQMYFQPAVTPVFERLHWLHNYVTIIVFIVLLFVMILLVYVCIRFSKKNNPVASKNSHNTLIEIIWTAVPVVILVAIAIPSFRAHYNCMHSIGCNEDGVPSKPDLTLKIVGNQWYWNYEYPDAEIQYDSYMKKEADLLKNEPRLLAVDNPLVVPVNANVRVLVTGSDVLHSWAMPAFGVKQDTVPGRLNETWFRAEKEGTYYGQCSELCGKGHGFMPIQVEVVSPKFYKKWLKAAKKDIAGASILVGKLRGRIESEIAQTEPANTQSIKH